MKPNQMPINPALLERAAEVWREAGDKLRFKVTAPFKLESGEQSACCIAFLPDLGSPQGMVVAPMMPAFDTDPLIKNLVGTKGCFCSFINVVGWDEYDEAAVKDALIDWGFFDPENERPQWLPKAQQK